MTRETDSTTGQSRRRLGAFLAASLMVIAVGLGFAGWRAVTDRQAFATIEVDRALRGTIAGDFARDTGRPPSERELDAAMEEWVRDEIVYREGVRKGLAGGERAERSAIIRRMEQAAATDIAPPSEAELAEWLGAHPERFGTDIEITFDQIPFSTRSRAIVGRTLLGGGADWRRLGDGDSLLPTYDGASRKTVERAFGTAFADAAIRMSPGTQWQGPVESTLGWHLVRVKAKVPGALPPLAVVRGRVEEDWRAARTRQTVDDAYKAMRSRYTVRSDR